MPKISVILASYNHAPFVREAMESALRQTGVDLELVVTDDGSTDGTVAAIRAVDDPRIRFVAFPENQGACVAMSDAIRRSRGEYVAVLNSDDYFLPGKLERQARFLDEHPRIGAVFALPLFVDERGAPFRNPHHAFAPLFTDQNRSRQEWLRHFFFQGNCLCHPTILIRRTCYDRIGLFNPLLMQLPDLDLWIRLCAAFEIHVLSERLTAFRILDRERNTSAPSRPRLARSAWEIPTVLKTYAGLSDADLDAILPPDRSADRGLPAKVRLALVAIAADKPGYAAFGLDLLRSSLEQAPTALPYREYFRLVGEADPLSAEFYSREHQWVRRSQLVAAARRLARWWRSRNRRG